MSLTYRDAGVDIDAGHEVVRRIGPLAARTRRAGVMADVGGFSGLFDLAAAGFVDPVLVSGTDGVGTKLKLAFLSGVHDTVGIDLVAMCANDVLTAGAAPLFFLDYFATGRLSPDAAEAVLTGIVSGCEQAGCALLGGETAEMPGMYADGEYDLAGFVVGAVERARLLTGERVEAGAALIGLPSSGLHSNGFSLVRHALLERRGLTLDAAVDRLDAPLGEVLLTPTRIYVKPVLEVLGGASPDAVQALAHITGGGLIENIPRVVPPPLGVEIDWSAWSEPAIFGVLRDAGVEDAEMRRTFNLGIGFVLVVAADAVEDVMARLAACGEQPKVIGVVTRGAGS